jgi:hypothetical protein
MKSIFILGLVIFMLLTFSVYGQNWKTAVNLNVNVNSSDQYDIFANRSGNHIILQKTNQLVYYLFNNAGTQIRTSVLDNSAVCFSHITGINNKLYVVYQKGGYIYTKRSENAGQSWTDITPREMDFPSSNGMDIFSDNDCVHLTWSEETDVVNRKYETHYLQLLHDETYWTAYKEITDTANDEGGFPSVTSSPGKVHVVYTKSRTADPRSDYGVENIREKDNATWQNPQLVVNNRVQCSHIIATSNKLHLFWHYEYFSMGFSELYYQNRNLSGGTWSSASQPINEAVDYHNFDLCSTQNDNVHIVLNDTYKMYNGSSWVDETAIGYYGNSHKIDGIGNDVFVLMTGQVGIMRSYF